jgi:hypothetical protein
MTDWAAVVESGRGIMAAPRLSRSERLTRGPEDEKFALGDLLAEIEDLDDGCLDTLAQQIGHNLTSANLRSYREVALAWPLEKRVAASWTVHRTLKNLANRFELIQPGMTLREAQVVAGKAPADTEHPSRWKVERRIDFVITQLQDKAIAQGVREQIEGRKHARAVRAAARAVEEERSAEYREALRELREARDSKHPERAVYDVIFKLRDALEYVRAVGRAGVEEHSFLPDHRRPDVLTAMRDLATGALHAMVAVGVTDRALMSAALGAVDEVLKAVSHPEVSGFSGVVIRVDRQMGEDVTPVPVTVVSEDGF